MKMCEAYFPFSARTKIDLAQIKSYTIRYNSTGVSYNVCLATNYSILSFIDLRYTQEVADFFQSKRCLLFSDPLSIKL